MALAAAAVVTTCSFCSATTMKSNEIARKTRTKTSGWAGAQAGAELQAAAQFGRRGFALVLVSVTTIPPLESNSRSALLQKYLKISKENKAKNEKERRDDYYKRNYKDYFQFIEGSLKAKKDELSESEKGILNWLEKNK